MKAHPPLVDPHGRPYTSLAIVEVQYYRTWRRGRLLKVARKRLAVEVVGGRKKRGDATWRYPRQVYVVPGA